MQPLFVENTIQINAPVSAVWNVLVNPEETKKYMFGCAAVSDWQPGSELLWQADYEGKEMVFVKGMIVHIEPGKILSYTVFDPNGTLEDIQENYLTVTYLLKDENGTTSLHVSQGDFSKAGDGEKRYQDVYNNGDGWNPILIQVKKIAEENR